MVEMVCVLHSNESACRQNANRRPALLTAGLRCVNVEGSLYGLQHHDFRGHRFHFGRKIDKKWIYPVGGALRLGLRDPEVSLFITKPDAKALV